MANYVCTYVIISMNGVIYDLKPPPIVASDLSFLWPFFTLRIIGRNLLNGIAEEIFDSFILFRSDIWAVV